jgi:glycosyltransferase involved in cell wall biosynthesis
MAFLGDDFEGHLWMHGANLEVQPKDFQDRFKPLLEETRETVTIAGAYERGRISRLMASIDWVVVPSIWWENSPLVIQEAFLHGRPIICSDIGGMAEKVEHGVSGLHFRRGDAEHLAEVMKKAAETPGLWDRLRSGIPAVHSMARHIRRLSDVYLDLIDLYRTSDGAALAQATAGLAE